MPNRARARELAAEHIARGDPLGWFERLYREADEGKSTVPWADLRPNPSLLDFWKRQPIATTGKTALDIGCGLGDDAEQLARWGFSTTAFDVSDSAIRACKRRFP
jgi:2-polyprenyl-3-methyl-5-hydroxy-6-metoxy-1,4-benzoquinol methylase